VRLGLNAVEIRLLLGYGVVVLFDLGDARRIVAAAVDRGKLAF
jgi:hypothetical protein